MNDNQLDCIVCGKTTDEVPVILFHFKGEVYGICPTHLPVLIHKPASLADKLPGIEKLQGAEGHEH
jgi:hypothetical protein